MYKYKEDCSGLPCERCGKIITTCSFSGLCRQCWYETHGRRQSGSSITERIAGRIEQHRLDKTHYHYLTINHINILEHRYIWERTHGKIPAGWIVHHLNGLKGDNRLENLVAIPRGDHHTHTDIFYILQERIRGLEETLEKV